MSDETLISELKDGVLLLTLNRPDKKNAINIPMWHAIREAFEGAAANDDVRVVVLTGAGKDFCAGVDLSDFSESDEDHPFDGAAEAVAHFDKPMIAAAKGVSVGGGATVLFHADIVYVGDSLRMRLPFVNLGLVPEWASSYMLQANIGARQAAELMYTAEWIDSARAVETGIATRGYSDEEVLDKAMEKAREIAKWPVNSLRETKRCMKVANEAGIKAAFAAERAGMEKQAGSPENIEAVMAFLEKREPDFEKLKG